MAIKYIHIEPQKKTVAVLEGCKYDAVNQIKKIINETLGLRIDESKYMMNNTYRSVVVCCEDDVYDPQVGEAMAKKKLMNKYYENLHATVNLFVNDINEAMFLLTCENKA